MTKSKPWFSSNVRELLLQVTLIGGGLVLILGLIFGVLRWQELREPKTLRNESRSAVYYGDPKPFVLRSAETGQPYNVDDHLGQRPIVLVFGSFSCPIFRAHIETLNRVYDENRDDMEFRVVYIREAHPPWMKEPLNIRDGIYVDDPIAYDGRVALAKRLVDDLGLRVPVLIDEMDDRVSLRYGRDPFSVTMINADGRVVFQGGVEVAPSVLEREFGRLESNHKVKRAPELAPGPTQGR